jgi:hypothetical protein
MPRVIWNGGGEPTRLEAAKSEEEQHPSCALAGTRPESEVGVERPGRGSWKTTGSVLALCAMDDGWGHVNHTTALFRQYLVSSKFQKFYKILRHIKFLDAYIEH